MLVVFTKDGETADAYIEREVHNLGRRFEVYVVTSDSLEQQTIFQRGAVRISSVEFYNLVRVDIEDVKKSSKKARVSAKNTLEDNLDDDVLRKLAVRISSVEFYNLVRVDIEDVKKSSKKARVSAKNTLEDNLDDDVLRKLEAIRRS